MNPRPCFPCSIPAFFAALVLALLFPAFSTFAQEAFFHRGAQHFLSGSNQLAKAEVERGLQQFPQDEPLKKFWELLNQQQQNDDKKDDEKKDEQKEQQNQNQDQKDQKDQKDQNKDQSESQKPDQQKKDSENQKPDPAKPEQEKKPEDQQSSSSGKKDQEKKEGENGQASKPEKPAENQAPEGQAQAAMIRMTPEQAVRLLDTLKGEERTLQFKPVLRTNRTDRILKDW